jgi:hypothetical protein
MAVSVDTFMGSVNGAERLTGPPVPSPAEPVDPIGSVSSVDPVDSARYRWNHQALLNEVFAPDPPVHQADSGPREPQSRLGAVLLPVSRSFDGNLPGLALAVELARAQECFLLVICSRQAKVNDFPPALAKRMGNRLILAELADFSSRWLPVLHSTSHRISKLRRSNDVGSKRNLGLAIAVALGWEYLLLVDDDIGAAATGPTLNPGQLAHALTVMTGDARLRAIGWTLEDYDDNSVVGHARPLAGLPQGIFIGGGALLVRCGAELPFFPDIYNEDWLFLIALAGGSPDPRQALGLGGRVHQRSYAPFRPARARSEEAGEIIGECLMNLLEDHGSRYDRGLTPGYWRRSLSNRWRLLQLIKESVHRVPTGPGGLDLIVQHCLIESMTAAQQVHADLRPMDLLHFVRTWRDDEELWQQHLRKLQGSLSLVKDPAELVKALFGGAKADPAGE